MIDTGIDIKDTAALVGAITGPAGLLIALLVYFRDRPNVRVSLTWNMKEVGNSENTEPFALVKVCNTGRRTIYLSNIHFVNPVQKNQNFTVYDGIGGVTLAEGSPPHSVRFNQNDKVIIEALSRWWNLRATVIDAAGKEYHSDWPEYPPSSAESIRVPCGAILWNKARNWMRRRLP